MAKKDKMEDFEVASVEAKAPVVLVKAPRTKVYGFEQWASLRGKPERHLGGMRAYLGDEAGHKFTLELWDEKMKAY